LPADVCIKMTIFTNGRVFVADGDLTAATNPFAQCMVVKDDHIEYVGQHDDAIVSQAKDAGAAVVDLANRIVVPGFIDSHMRLLLLGLALSKVDLGHCTDFGAISATIKSYAETHPAAPRIFCRGWMHSMTNGIALASMLDAVEKRPVFVDSKDLHSAWCNTAALEELGVESMRDPVGGEIHRDVSGRASGLLSEAAAVAIVWPHLSRVATMEENWMECNRQSEHTRLLGTRE
jgi:predicted amidohydrolase YtcJ